MSSRWDQPFQGLAPQVGASHSAPSRFVPTLGVCGLAGTWPVPPFTLSTLCCLPLPTVSCFPPDSEQLADSHTWFPFLSCLWYLGAPRGLPAVLVFQAPFQSCSSSFLLSHPSQPLAFLLIRGWLNIHFVLA